MWPLVSHPVLCNYYLTFRCNATCNFCDIWEKPSPYASLQNIEQNLIHLKRLGVKVIDFTGGEPLLHREIDEILKLAKKYGFITTITTNGLLYPKWAERLKGLVDMLHFSLDSPHEEEHDKGRGVKCFSFVQQSIEVAQELGERPDILFTVFPHNVHQIQEMWETYAVKKDLVLILNPVFAYNEVETQGGLQPPHLKDLRRWARRKNVFLNEAFLELRLKGGNQIEDPVCKAASTTIVISPANELVMPCYHLGVEHIPIQDNLFELYHSERVRLLRKLEGRLPACQGCTINCYMQPSFTTHFSRYWMLAAPSALKYNYLKGTWKALLK